MVELVETTNGRHLIGAHLRKINSLGLRLLPGRGSRRRNDRNARRRLHQRLCAITLCRARRERIEDVVERFLRRLWRSTERARCRGRHLLWQIRSRLARAEVLLWRHGRRATSWIIRDRRRPRIRLRRLWHGRLACARLERAGITAISSPNRLRLRELSRRTTVHGGSGHGRGIVWVAC